MPIYEYKCTSCAAVSEALRRMADRDAPEICKQCGASAEHILSSFGISNKSKSDQHEQIKSPHSDAGGIQIRNCTIEGAAVGVSLLKGTKIDLRGTRFKNVKTPIEFRDE